jgi:hypothetical protein
MRDAYSIVIAVQQNVSILVLFKSLKNIYKASDFLNANTVSFTLGRHRSE